MGHAIDFPVGRHDAMVFIGSMGHSVFFASVRYAIVTHGMPYAVCHGMSQGWCHDTSPVRNIPWDETVRMGRYPTEDIYDIIMGSPMGTITGYPMRCSNG